MKKIFITGASSGIGRATAELLAARGDEVWGTSRDPSRIAARARLHGVALDLANPSSVRAGFATALAEAGGFDVVINNAGAGHFGPGEQMSDAAVRRQFETLVFAHLEIARLSLAAMRERGSGRVINVTSLASRLPVPFMAAYNAAKAAMATFTMSLQLEMEHPDIRVLDVQPGDIRTAFNDAIDDATCTVAHYGGRVQKAWRIVDRNMKNAPGPDLVARHIAKLIDDPNPPPRVTVGDGFQSVVAPLIWRLLPQRMRVWSLRRYYGI